jgi:hypothetical protein
LTSIRYRLMLPSMRKLLFALLVTLLTVVSVAAEPPAEPLEAARAVAAKLEAATETAEDPTAMAFAAATLYGTIGDFEASLRVNEMIPKNDARYPFALAGVGRVEDALAGSTAVTINPDDYDLTKPTFIEWSLATAMLLGHDDRARLLVEQLESAMPEDVSAPTVAYRMILGMEIQADAGEEMDRFDKTMVFASGAFHLLCRGERVLAQNYAELALANSRWLQEDVEEQALALEQVVFYYGLAADTEGLAGVADVMEAAGGVLAATARIEKARLKLLENDREAADTLLASAATAMEGDEFPAEAFLSYLLGRADSVDEAKVAKVLEDVSPYHPDYLLGLGTGLYELHLLANPLPAHEPTIVEGDE